MPVRMSCECPVPYALSGNLYFSPRAAQWPAQSPFQFPGCICFVNFQDLPAAELLCLWGLAAEERTQRILVTGCAFLVGPGLASEESDESGKNRTLEVEGEGEEAQDEGSLPC